MAITEFLKTRKNACHKLVEELHKKYSYASILGVDSKSCTIRKDFFTTNITDDSEQGFVVKVYDGEGYIEYACCDINDDNYLEVLNSVLGVSLSSDVKRVNAKLIKEESLTQTFERVNEAKLSNDEIIKYLDKFIEYAKTRENIINSICIVGEQEINKIFISKNKDLEQSYPWNDVRFIPISRRDDDMKNSLASEGGKDLKPLLDKVSTKLSETCDIAIALLDAEPMVPGTYEVITDPSITGLIVHEAFGHGVEMDMFVKNRAKAKDYVGKYVASPLVNMHDGAGAAYSVASYFFDDDGVIAQDTKIIENGILKQGISDSLSAMQLQTQPTGNGRRERYTHKSYTRMTNTFFTPGTDKLEDMIKSIKYGFYLVDTNNGMEDPKNWQIQCVCEYAREIKDGKFTGKLFSPVVMSGYVLDVLKSITMVSDEFKIDGGGSCGKGHKEWVRVSDGGPHLKAMVKLG